MRIMSKYKNRNSTSNEKKKKNLRAIAIKRQPAVPFVPESDMCLGRAEKQRRSEQKVLCFILVFKIELNIVYSILF